MPTPPDPSLLDRWKPVIAAFDPQQPLSRDQIDALYVERPQAPYVRVLDELHFDPAASPVFVICGSHGSGRSTELACLERHLHQTRAILEIDLDRALPQPAGTLGLLLVLGLAALKACEAWTAEGQEIATAIRRLEGAASTLTGDDGDHVFPINELIEDVGATVTISTPHRPARRSAFAARTQGQIIWHPDAGPAAQAASDRSRWAILRAVNLAFETLERASGLPPVVLADDLDRLSDLDALVQVLDDPKLLAALRAPLVLTGPVNLLHSARFHEVRRHVHLLPLFNLPVVPADDAPEPPNGVDLLLEAVHRRQVHHKLPNLWIDQAAVPPLAQGSAGSLRDFIGLLRGAALSAYNKGAATLKVDDALKALRDRRHLLQFTLTEHSVDLLHHILASRRAADDPHFDELLFNNVVVCYPNDNLWYRPHEILVEWLEAPEGPPLAPPHP